MFHQMENQSNSKEKYSMELFGGAGGLALGVEMAGFRHKLIIELDDWACKTLASNLECLVLRQNIKNFNFCSFGGEVDLLTGGPPCQPFSYGGIHKAYLDSRDMFPDAIRAVREISPKTFLFENVRGLLRKSFSQYFEYIVFQLSYPEVIPRKDEEWTKHMARLQRHKKQKGKINVQYHVAWKVLNAADFGIPQRRERLFIVGFRNDLNADWSFPAPTHSFEALLWSQLRSGAYWRAHRLAASYNHLSIGNLKQANKIENAPSLLPWRTVRDAFKGLPNPSAKENKYATVSGHQIIHGARSYPGHTGSPFDLPAKTLKAGVHGVPGGENMLLLPSGEVRYFTIRECARLQDFPDDFELEGSWGKVIKQLGNAVPVGLASILAKSIFNSF